MTQQVAQGSTITLNAQYRTNGGVLVDPVTPLLDIFDSSNTEVVSNAVPTRDGVGLYHYNYAVDGAAPLGVWQVVWSGVIDGSGVQGEDYFEVVTPGSIVIPSADPPCTPYATTSDLCSPCDDYSFPTGLLDDMLEVASGVMYHLTGEQFEGQCADTVYPTCQQGRRGYGGLGYEHWRPGDPRVWAGANLRDFCGGCKQISLGGYPITGITTVTIEGEILDPDDYQVEDSRWLTRTDGSCWPCSCSCGANTDFEVVYTYGLDAPPLLVKATADLACQMALACSPETLGDCVLPSNVSSVTRQGVTAEMIPFAGLLNGESGIPSVNAAIDALNPDHRRGRSVIARADMGRAVRRITTA